MVGLDIISDVLIVYGECLCKWLLVVNCVKMLMEKFKIVFVGFLLGEFKFLFFGVVELCIGMLMG